MSLIYTPKGRALEYSPLALSVYTGGCPHGCTYCFNRDIFRGKWTDIALPRNLKGLEREAAKASRQILLSFAGGDPYGPQESVYRNTRKALIVLRDAGCSVAILTKGGSHCLRDLDLFTNWPGGRIKVGATLTSWGKAFQEHWEPGAASPCDRIDALRRLQEAGIKTWASIEPVIDTEESLAAIDASLPYVDAYKVGKWNHDTRANEIDWASFGWCAVDMIHRARRKLYVKADLRPYLPTGCLRLEECAMDALTLPDRNWPRKKLNYLDNSRRF